MNGLNQWRSRTRRAATTGAIVAFALFGCGTTEDAPHAEPTTTRPTADPSRSLLKAEYSRETLASLQDALRLYDEARRLLIEDSVAGVAAAARSLGDVLSESRAGLESVDPILASLGDEAVASASSLAEAEDLETARQAFGEVSRSLIGIAAVDTRLIEGWRSFSCPMTSTFPR